MRGSGACPPLMSPQRLKWDRNILLADPLVVAEMSMLIRLNQGRSTGWARLTGHKTTIRQAKFRPYLSVFGLPKKLV